MLNSLTMNPGYVTVYQIGSDPQYASFDSGNLYFGIAFFSVGAAILIIGLTLIARSLVLRRKKWLPWVIAISMCLFGGSAIWLFGLPHRLREDEKAIAALREGHFQTVEGVVVDFDPMPFEGHKLECFRVEKTRFCYSDYRIEPGFRETASHGGPIHSGLRVRIAYVPSFRRNTILQIEIPNYQESRPQQVR
jgi:hypothetical protein